MPRSLCRQHRGELVSIRAGNTFVGVGATPTVVGKPGRRCAQQQDGRGVRSCRSSHDKQMLLLNRIAPPLCGQRDDIASRVPVVRHGNIQGDRPVATGHGAVVGRRVGFALEVAEQRHPAWRVAVACDFQVKSRRGRVNMKTNGLARRIAVLIRVAPDLENGGITRGSDVIVIKDMWRAPFHPRRWP